MDKLEAELREDCMVGKKAEGLVEGELRKAITTVENLLIAGVHLDVALDCTYLSESLWIKYQTLGSIDLLLADIKNEVRIMGRLVTALKEDSEKLENIQKLISDGLPVVKALELSGVDIATYM